MKFKTKVLDFKAKKDFIYVSLENEKKIMKIDNNTLENVKNFTHENIKNDIIKFLVLDQTIYAIEKNVGLIVFD